jgi:hypothetical protein
MYLCADLRWRRSDFDGGFEGHVGRVKIRI